MQNIKDIYDRIIFLKKKNSKWIATSGGYNKSYYHEENNPLLLGQLKIIAKQAYSMYPLEEPIFHNLLRGLYDGFIDSNNFDIFLDYLLRLVKRDLDAEKNKYDKEKVFLTANERISEAGKSFRQENYPSCISNVHVAVEIALKEKLKIPPTIKEIKIGPLIGHCIRQNVFPDLKLFLKDLHSKANIVDNDFKHQSYNPKRSEAFEALSLGEKFISEIEKTEPKLAANFHEGLSKSIKYLSARNPEGNL